jgi:hypothetical protein
MVRRSILAALLAASLAMLSIGTAFAHECAISSRSSRGDEAATNSKIWEKLYLETVLRDFIGLPEPVVEKALELRPQFGLPEYWVTRFDRTVGGGSANPNLTDGRGLDHLVGLVGPQLDDLIAAAINEVSGGG